MEKLLTLSVAAYNCDKYLDKCLGSMIIEQELSNIEVLIVNDGSKDNTEQIANCYCKRYPNTFKLINKENGGHGSTINVGIQEATGLFFKVVDSDDWLIEEGITDILNYIREGNQPDIIVTKYKEIYEGTGKVVDVVKPNIRYNAKITSINEIEKIDMIQIHSIFVKTSNLKKNNVLVTEHCFYEDVEYVYKSLAVSNTVAFLDTFNYMYRLDRIGQSVAVESQKRNIESSVKLMYNILEFFDEFERTTDLNSGKYKYIKRRVILSAYGRYLVFLFFSPSKEVYHKLIEYNKCLKDRNRRLFVEMEKSYYIVRLINKEQYSSYRIAVLYRNVRLYLANIKKRINK